jgi:uncharacterized OsmC-like protein
MKKVEVQATLGEGMQIEGKLGGHTAIIDQPNASGGQNAGPTPLQYQIFALVGCLGSIARIIATQKKINLRGINFKAEGDLDVDYLLGKTKEGRAGFHHFHVTADIDADMTLEEKKEFMHEVDSRCPVSCNFVNPTIVHVDVAP